MVIMDPSKYLEMVNNCDENATLLSATPLGQYLNYIPLNSVQPSHLTQFHQSLNIEQLISTKAGLARDYRGLAELMGHNSIELEARFKRSYNPTKCLVDAFAARKDTHNCPASVTDLLKLVEKLERFDVLDDLLPTLIKITHESHTNLGQQQVATRNSDNNIELNQHVKVVHEDGDSNRLNHHERLSSSGHKYDAFLCYAPEDVDYAQDIMRVLERNNRRIVTVDNLLAGQFEYDALVQMIAVECRKVIIILTPNFLDSRDCEFQTKFANEIAIKSGWFPKIIPILCEPLDDAKLPSLIRITSKINMTRANQRDWQLRKLLESLDYSEQSSTHSMAQHTGRLAMSPRPPSIREPDDCEANATGVQNGLSTDFRSSSATSNLSSDRSTPGPTRPIIDLAYSQSSSANISCHLSDLSNSQYSNQDSINIDSLRLSPTSQIGTGGPSPWRNFYRSLTRKWRGSSLSTSPSSSSRNILIQTNSNTLESTSDLDGRSEYKH